MECHPTSPIIKELIHTLKTNPKLLRQTGYLFGSYLLLILLGFGIKSIQTDQLGEVDYGRYAFFVSVSSFLLLFLRFGYFASLRVLLAENNDPRSEKRLMTVGMVLTLICGVLLALATAGASFVIDDIFATDISHLLWTYAPLVIVMPFFFFFTAYGSGANRILLSAVFTVLPKAIFFIALLLLVQQGGLDLGETVAWQLLSTLIAIGLIFSIVRPDFSDFKPTWRLVHDKNKAYGRHYNLGAIANQTTYRLDEFFITYFVDAVHLGFYSLANFICTPMTQLSNAVINSAFKDLNKMERIPRQLFVLNSIWLGGCVIFLALSAGLIVHTIFSVEFDQVATYILPLSLVYFIHGSTMPFSFLAAKSMGREIRNAAWMEAIINIAGNFLLIGAYGVMGAILASGLAKGATLLMNIYYYRRYLAR